MARPEAREIGLGEREIGPRLRQACLRLRQRGLERPPVDGEQEVALAHDLAVAKVDGVEIARNARPHLYRLDRNEPADVLVLIRQQFADRLCHGHGGRGGGGRPSLRLALSAGGERRSGGDQQCEDQLSHRGLLRRLADIRPVADATLDRNIKIASRIR